MAWSKSSIYLRLGILGALCTPFLVVLLHGFGYELKLWGCPLKALVGIPCPTWGLTRAVFAIATHNWSAASRYHLLAPLIVLLWGIAVLQISFELLTKRVWSLWWRRRSLWLSGLMLLFGYHSMRLYQLWMTGTLAAYRQHSLLSHLL